MSNSYFKFKQFTVWHDKCAMKVGTDGVLLGTWANLTTAHHVLDIGTGTGLIALIAAQRNSNALITALEIDAMAARQARENFEKSPWNNRIQLIHQDVLTYNTSIKYDAVLCNPPYFQNSLKCPDQQRATARHTDTLSYEQLVYIAKNLISEIGEFSVILPFQDSKDFEYLAHYQSLHTSRRTIVHTTAETPPKRILLAFKLSPQETKETHLTIGRDKSSYSEEFKELVKYFYL